MQRLRTTFKRSRTPTGAEMKTQSSLEVPKQVRSASFDEIQLEAQRALQQQQSGELSSAYLRVPSPATQQRSKSFDATGSDSTQDPSPLTTPLQHQSSDPDSGMYLEVPSMRKFQRRRSSSDKLQCWHCQCVEEYARQQSRQSSGDDTMTSSRSFSPSDTSSNSDLDSDSDEENNEFNVVVTEERDLSERTEDEDTSELVTAQCCISVILSPPLSPTTLTLDLSQAEPPPSPTDRERRRSITSPKLERQEAFIFNETTEFAPAAAATTEYPASDTSQENAVESSASRSSDVIVNEFFLAVPDLKRDRAASVDSCFIQKTTPGGKAEEVVLLEPPQQSGLRSRSVDIVLPTDEQARYKALAMSNARHPTARGKAVQGDGESGPRQIRSTPDWGDTATNGEHLWVPTSASGDFCYVGEGDCTKHGARMKCAACKIVAHANCINILMDRVHFTCKPTFRDVGVRQYREQTCIHHHWVHRRSQKGKCKQCGKSFQSKLSFSSKEIVALSCSWCKTAYHNKESCFNLQKIGEECHLGTHSSIIVPPSWIVKLPRKGSFKSSLRKSPKKKPSSKKRSKEKTEKDSRTFAIKPIPTLSVRPVIVFINPKSGGNQGAKLLQKFQWLLNPRQVFDLTQGGPKMGLELFRKVPNLRVLACGGDGTAGWVLSILDQLAFSPPPAVGVLPLGTGNDLARALGWGGGYTDEPISKILCNIGESEIIQLDRWELKVEKNNDAQPNEEGKDNLPLNVVNNYFSLGVDAHIALEFHEAREAHPERFNSRLRNKMFYGQMGGKDLLRRKWKNLADFVTLECDGKDLTPKLKEHRVHAIVFLNIPSYGGGTRPWNTGSSTIQPATDDGLIEVIGLTTYQLPLLQAGGHGTSICQCKSAKMVTGKTIPMQVDGEACRLNPSIISLNLLNKAQMLAKRKGGKANVSQATLDQLKVSIQRISMMDYEQHHYDKEKLRQSAMCLGEIEVNPSADLEQVRQIINKLQEEPPKTTESGEIIPKLTPDWCFVDSCTAERFFRVDRAQEHLHYLTDIANEMLFVLDALPQTPDDEPSNFPPQQPSNSQTTPELSPSEDPGEDSMDFNKISIMHQDSTDTLVNQPLSDRPDDRTQFVIPKLHTPDDDSDSIRFNPKESLSPAHASGNSPYISVWQRLFDVGINRMNFSELLEKPSDGILKAAKMGNLKLGPDSSS
ncbi:eye-specific diacylglycerol kinase isoform X5 [Bemisia tabaci]|uniref:eye-specific diacylglycerol kinase isoform X5 n=1 Tax=Bemisia tabaci TaxID=7038 RepID=UPI003B27BEAB